MFNKTNKIINILSHPKVLKMLISMNSSGYLKEIGWVDSFRHQMPIDKEGHPLPWATYGFIDFISGRLNGTMDIFEFGSGNSTLWYAAKVHTVTSVEHDDCWFEKIKNNMPENVSIHHQDLVYGEEYCSYSNNLDKKFDIVIVDGRDRVNCIKNAIYSIHTKGVIVLDDSERESYKDGIIFLQNKGFRRIDFWGIAPGLFYKKNTTVFYKIDNCLGI